MTIKSIKQVNNSVFNNQSTKTAFNFTGLNNSNFLALQEKVERLDTTINAIDFSGSDIVFNNPDISAINSRIDIIDISIVNINNDISININNITDINTSINNIEISLNDISLNIGEIPDIIEINTRLDTLDTSLNSVSDRISSLDTYVYDLSLDLVEFKHHTDLSFSSTVSYLETSIQDLSSNLYSYVTTRVEEIIDSAPESLDTLRELADALSGDASFAITIQQQQTRQDASLALLETQLETLSTTIDTSLNAITDNIAGLDISVNAITDNITILDTSVNTITDNITILDTSVNTITDNITGLDISVNLNTVNIAELDISVNLNTVNIAELDISVNLNTVNIAELDTSLNTVTDNITSLDASINTLNVNINYNTIAIQDLSDSLNRIEISLNSVPQNTLEEILTIQEHQSGTKFVFFSYLSPLDDYYNVYNNAFEHYTKVPNIITTAGKQYMFFELSYKEFSENTDNYVKIISQIKNQDSKNRLYNSSLIAPNFTDIYTYLLTLYSNTSIYSIIDKLNTIFVRTHIPLYITWQQNQPEYLFLLDYLDNYNRINSLTNNNYIINFSPCIFDELDVVNQTVEDLQTEFYNKNTPSNYTALYDRFLGNITSYINQPLNSTITITQDNTSIWQTHYSGITSDLTNEISGIFVREINPATQNIVNTQFITLISSNYIGYSDGTLIHVYNISGELVKINNENQLLVYPSQINNEYTSYIENITSLTTPVNLFIICIDDYEFNQVVRYYSQNSKNIEIYRFTSSSSYNNFTNSSYIPSSGDSTWRDYSPVTESSNYLTYLYAIKNNPIILDNKHINSNLNVKLISIPIEETINDNEGANVLGMSINKSISLFCEIYKQYSDIEKNKSYLYLLTKTHKGEEEMVKQIKTFNHSDVSINSLLDNKRIIITSRQTLNFNDYNDISGIQVIQSYKFYDVSINKNINKSVDVELPTTIIETPHYNQTYLDTLLIDYLVNREQTIYGKYIDYDGLDRTIQRKITGRALYNQYKNLLNTGILDNIVYYDTSLNIYDNLEILLSKNTIDRFNLDLSSNSIKRFNYFNLFIKSSKNINEWNTSIRDNYYESNKTKIKTLIRNIYRNMYYLNNYTVTANQSGSNYSFDLLFNIDIPNTINVYDVSYSYDNSINYCYYYRLQDTPETTFIKKLSNDTNVTINYIPEKTNYTYEYYIEYSYSYNIENYPFTDDCLLVTNLAMINVIVQ